MRTSLRSMLASTGVALAIAAVTTVSAGAAGLRAERCPDVTRPAMICSADDADCVERDVIDIDRYWLQVSQCLRSIRTVWSRGGAEAEITAGSKDLGAVSDLMRTQIRFELGKDNVRITDETGEERKDLIAGLFEPGSASSPVPFSIFVKNDLGQPYNGMGQGGMAQVVFSIAARAEGSSYPESQTDAAAYRAIANAIIRPVLTPVAEGGLASTETCDNGASCTWYHSVTRRDRAPDKGATLNQMLHVLRDLGLIADLHEKMGWTPQFDYDGAITAGLKQLFLGTGHKAVGLEPTLEDFESEPGLGSTWAYYGFSAARQPGKGGYFLRNEEKNCNYHFHVLNLMRAILARQEKRGITSVPASTVYACEGPLAEFYDMARVAARSKDGSARSLPQPAGIKTPLSCSAKALSQFKQLRRFYGQRLKQC
ncbi:hypothetical protein [Methylobrevis pamukkalensis]|uniref:Uncharacterized protein n=1 Tax=Methylobrevis pamukkalensis TaxID=1439726 RepID=A0A1E3H3V6_9HYPH|nr:hypothetical protein [Methylobrevis pamukkalensis]ODN71013.1 hypothetical protein A6302_01647 [Methylobrevis pamukkalensis]